MSRTVWVYAQQARRDDEEGWLRLDTADGDVVMVHLPVEGITNFEEEDDDDDDGSQADAARLPGDATSGGRA